MEIAGSPTDGASTRVEIITTSERLQVVASAWRTLWQEQRASVFQSHEWISAWWDNFNDQRHHRLRIGLLWRGELLIAVLPLAICHRKGFRFLEWAAIVHSDYGDLLKAADCSLSELRELWNEIVARGGFDILAITRVIPNSNAARLLDHVALSERHVTRGERPEVSYRVGNGDGDGTAWYNRLSKKMRKTYRHGYNVLERSGHLQFRRLADDEPLQPILARLADLKQKSLQGRGLSSDLFTADMRLLTAFVDVIRRFSKLHVFLLELDGSIAAISVNFEENGTMMCWITTFDAAITQTSPGLLLMIDYIKWSFDQGLVCVDFLSGGEAFKNRFATHSVVLESLTGPRNLKGGLGLRAYTLRGKFVALRSARLAKAQPDEE
ncbi:GNAT family N-acetyltransferase [Rhizobium sp. FKY42]|uniref:GNAT family N-acetyltransferase n=1 Tax=Rhizobium sp. FKY42 TaxID=2562310 RepID=UPI0010BFA4A9|nr:GNAT family N-acetyltransferase [Rhizobium sp. FKY42]